MFRRAAVISLLLTTSGCFSLAGLSTRSEARLDTREALTLTAAKLRPASPAPRWERLLSEPEVDVIVELPANKVLIGTVGVEVTDSYTVAVYQPRLGPYLCVDSGTGQILWEHARDGTLDDHYDVLATTPRLIIDHRGPRGRTLSGLEIDSGNESWSRAIAEGAEVIVAEKEGLLIISGDAEAPLFAIDAATAERRWTAKEEQPWAGATLMIHGTTLFELGERVRARTLLGGEKLWSSSKLGINAGVAAPLVVQDKLIVASNEAVISLDLSSGSTRWHKRLSKLPLANVVSGSTLVSYLSAGPNEDRLVALNLKNGSLLWEKPLKEVALSAAVASGNRLAFTTASTFELWDLLSGRVIASHSLPGLVLLERPADHVVFRDGQVVYVSDRAVGAFRASDGAPVYDYPLRGVADFSPTVIAKTVRYLKAKQGVSSPATPPEKISAVSELAAPAKAEAISARQWANLLASRQDVSSQTQLSALQSAHRAEVTAARTEFAVAAGAAAGAVIGTFIFAALDELKQEAVETYLERREAALAIAMRSYRESVVGFYHLRPVRLHLGDGLLVIDLRDGSWCELPVSPYDGMVGEYALLGAQPAKVIANQLITKGITLDPESFEVDELSVGVTTVKRSLFAFTLDELPMETARRYQSQTQGRTIFPEEVTP